MGKDREFIEAFTKCLIIIIVIIILSLIRGRYEPILSKVENRPSLVKAESLEDLSPLRFVRRSLGFFIVTAYCPNECCCEEYADGITASGHVIKEGDQFCAADPVIPFGMILDIEGYGIVPVLDRGGKIKGNKIDIFFWTHEEALEWGVQELEIFCWIKEGE